MSIWKEFSETTLDLIINNYSDKHKINIWNSLKKKVVKNNYIPWHFGKLFSSKALKDNRVEILDHGCGTCITLSFFAIKGFKNIWGLTVNFSNDPEINIFVKKVNNFFNLILKENVTRVKIYNGRNIPFKSNKFDIIYSQQVFEHVTPELKIPFIKEEMRILKDNGLLYHQIPHRLVPYESHTKVWLLHWLPKKLFKVFFKKHKAKFIENHLFLDWPWKIKKIFLNEKFIYENLTSKRLVEIPDSKKLKGITMKIRKLTYKLFIIPYFGKFFLKILSNIYMLEIVLRKKP